MWALDYKNPGDYSFEHGDFYDLLEKFPEKCLFSSREEAEKYGRLYSEVDQNLKTVYAVKYDEESGAVEVVNGTKSELCDMGFSPDDIMLWEEEAQKHKELLINQINSKHSVRYGVEYRGPDDYSIEMGQKDYIREKYPARCIFDSQAEAENRAQLWSDADKNLIPIYHVLKDQEHGTSEIVSGTKGELVAMGYDSQRFYYTLKEAQMGKLNFEQNQRIRRDRKKRDC